MPSRRLLVVTYFYPPDTSVGSHRWPAMARYLRELGHEVTILTTAAFGTMRDDRPWVVRTADLQGASALRRMLRRPPIAGTEVPAGPLAPASRLLTDGLVPDAHVVSWLPFAVTAARRLVRERDVDCVITNGPPDSTHLLGLALGTRRPPWVIDLEDGWRFEPLREGWPTRAQDRLDAALERQTVRRADAAVGLSRPIADDLGERLGAAAAYVPNGWDPALEPEIGAARPPELEAGTFTLVHTGGLSHGAHRDPRALFRALDLLVREDPQLAGRMRLVLAGRLTTADAALLDGLTPRVRGILRHVGEQPRAAAVALQRRADALLLLASGARSSQVTGKLFEYLAADRPIVALAAANEAARIVRETQTGRTADPHDPAAIAALLREALDGRLAAAFRPRGIDAYRFPGPAASMASVVEDAIARRAAGRAAVR